MANYSIDLPPGPLYDPNSKIVKFRFEEDYEVISQNQLGKDKLFEDHKFLFYLGEDKEWKRPYEIAKRPYFVKVKPDRNDALQGYLGNCWFVSAITALTLNDDLIKHVVPLDQSFVKNYVGVFHFRIWQLGTWYDVVVDDRLPVAKGKNELCYLTSRDNDVFWGALLEKAYAKVYSSITIAPVYDNPPSRYPYDDLEIGLTMTGLQDLSGGIVEKVFLDAPHHGMSIKNILKKSFTGNALMVFESYEQKAGIMDVHTYTLTNVFEFPDTDPHFPGLLLVRLMNPWGFQEWEGAWSDEDNHNWNLVDSKTRRILNNVRKDEGEFWMDEHDLIKRFGDVLVCYLGPGQYLTSHYYLDIKSWRTTTFYGEWARPTSGGADISDRHKNPQYRILLDFHENDTDNDGMCTVIVELTRLVNYNRNSSGISRAIVFYVYSLTRLLNVPMPLDADFFSKYNPILEPDRHVSDGRSYVMTLTLDPGKYCIVPCTVVSDQYAPFILRVFSESRVELWEYDTPISKSLPTEEQNLNQINEELQTLFHNVAQSQGEIDWNGLKEILDSAMNRKRSFFGMIASFFYFIKDTFEKYLPLQSSNDYETGDIVFTKDECRSMIAMLDDDHSGKLSFSEFCKLWNKICFWTKVYEQHKDDGEGYVTIDQLKDALSSIGYNINNRTLHSLGYIYVNEQGNILLRDFILCGITLDTILTLHEKKYSEGKNKIPFTLEEWVKCTLVL